MNPLPSPQEAWDALPANEWNEASARHLLRRTGWAARPDEVTRALKDGLPRTLERLFPERPPAFTKPGPITVLEQTAPELARNARTASSPEERMRIQRELREKSQQAFQDLGVKWLQYAAEPDQAAFAKWAFFLGNIYVVGQDKVRQSNLIYEHQEILFRHALGSAPVLTKAVSRSPAMIVYLDLQASRQGAPNENFARELFELFTLGEGNYTEADIKEAARAFTGYRQLGGQVRIVRAQADLGSKTVFGRTGRFDGDDVIDVVYDQPAAATFLPKELVRFYLSDEPVPDAHMRNLGAWWRATGFDLRRLALRFFSSRLFFAPAYRGAYIKSPVQFYLGLLHDLDLNVTPVPRFVLNSFRQMGQILYQPPNVRGWVGGRLWINSATLSARRQLVQSVFAPFNEAILNADEWVEIAAARAEGRSRFNVNDDALSPYASLEADLLTTRLIDQLIPLGVDDDYRTAVRAFAANQPPEDRARNTLLTLMQSPEYQLC